MSGLSVWMRRDPTQEAHATDLTKSLRQKLDSLGVEWGLGVFPNVETIAYAETLHGVALVNVFEDGRGGFCVSYMLDGMSANEAAYVAASGMEVVE